MHKTPSQIARSLRTFKTAHRMGWLRSVRIVPGNDACVRAKTQSSTDYPGTSVPRLPLDMCNRDYCDCSYAPEGTEKLRRLNVNANPKLLS